jgi:hypothetical protein
MLGSTLWAVASERQILNNNFFHPNSATTTPKRTMLCSSHWSLTRFDAGEMHIRVFYNQPSLNELPDRSGF